MGLKRVICVSRSERVHSFCDRSFSAAVLCLWNALPSYMPQDLNYRHFKKSQKGHTVKL